MKIRATCVTQITLKIDFGMFDMVKNRGKLAGVMRGIEFSISFSIVFILVLSHEIRITHTAQIKLHKPISNNNNNNWMLHVFVCENDIFHYAYAVMCNVYQYSKLYCFLKLNSQVIMAWGRGANVFVVTLSLWCYS